MGIFGGSDEKKAEIERMKAEVLRRQNEEIKSAYKNADDNSRFIAFSNVYVSGGQVDGTIWGFDKQNAETALRDYITLLTNL